MPSEAREPYVGHLCYKVYKYLLKATLIRIKYSLIKCLMSLFKFLLLLYYILIFTICFIETDSRQISRYILYLLAVFVDCTAVFDKRNRRRISDGSFNNNNNYYYS